MDYKKASAVLINLLKHQTFKREEKEAISTAIGILSWVSLGKSRLIARKEKREKFAKWNF